MREIGAKMQFKVCHQNIWRRIALKGVFTYRWLKKTICHTADNNVKRVLWAMDYIGWKSEWSKVIFSDEKNFNIYGPYGVKN